MRDYIWRYPRGSYIQERWFDLGNPGLITSGPLRLVLRLLSSAHNYDIVLGRGRLGCIPLALRGIPLFRGLEGQEKGGVGTGRDPGRRAKSNVPAHDSYPATGGPHKKSRMVNGLGSGMRLDSSFSGVLVSHAAYNHTRACEATWAHAAGYPRKGCTQKTLGWLSGPRRFTRSTRRPRPQPGHRTQLIETNGLGRPGEIWPSGRNCLSSWRRPSRKTVARYTPTAR